MSFTSKVKDELSRVEPSCGSCARSELAALCRFDGSLIGGGHAGWSLQVATETYIVARAIIIHMKNVYNLRPELIPRKSVLHKTSNFLLIIPASKRLENALVDMGILNDSGGLEMGIRPDLVENECCTAAYLRGAFMSGGFISHPHGDFHFELVTQHPSLAHALIDLLSQYEITARFAPRRNAYTVYIKSSEDIIDFLALVGAHNAVLEIESERVLKSVRNEVNRRVNAEIANQDRSSSAALEQLKLIEFIENNVSASLLTPALIQFMDLRRAYPHVSLRELGEHASPPLSKSAVYHRLRRLEEIAEDAKSAESK